MPSGEWPIGRRQAKEKPKKRGESRDYNLIEKFLQDKEKVREDRWQKNKLLQERKLLLKERKIANEEKNRFWEQEKEQRKITIEEKILWEQEQKIMFSDLNTLDPSQKTYVIAMRAQIAAKKMAAFNNTFGGSSGGHEASGGGEFSN
jgi:hypothetical protein